MIQQVEQVKGSSDVITGSSFYKLKYYKATDDSSNECFKLSFFLSSTAMQPQCDKNSSYSLCSLDCYSVDIFISILHLVSIFQWVLPISKLSIGH